MDKTASLNRTLALVAGVMLAACGGGADDAPAAAPPPPPIVPVADPTGDCKVAGTSAAFIADAVARVNAFRAQARTCGTTVYPAAPAVAWNDKLAQAAYAHANDMATKNYFAHDSQDGRTFDQRITAAGYAWSTVAENIAAGPVQTVDAMTGWQQSAGHCRNLMAADVRDVGLSCKRGASGATYPTYWAMELGAPR